MEDRETPRREDDASGQKAETEIQDAKNVERVAPNLSEVAKSDDQRLSEIKKKHKQVLDQARKAQNLEVEADEQQANKDRLKFLLHQTEIFAHFIKDGALATGKSAPVGRSKKGSAPKRGRKTETEEDAEILEEAAADLKHEVVDTFTATPSWINGTMRDYQVRGLNWLIKLYENGINGILADEMGLGKTLQTISVLGYLHHERGIRGPHLIITPKSTLSNWMNEFHRWCPAIRVIKFHGDKEERVLLREKKLVAGKFEVAVTTYEMAIAEKSALKKFSWRYLIIDEAHRIKNEKSILSQVVRLYSSQFRLLLTGTPLQNNLHELWALLNFLLPDVFGSSEDFDSWFDLSKEGEETTLKDQQEVVEKLHQVLRPFLLRRLKVEVEKDLPPKKEIKLFVGMSAMQKEWYTQILSKDIEALNGVTKGKGDRMRLLNIVMQLRKACNHPYLFHGAEPGPPFTTGEHLVTNSGKLVVLDKLLPKLKAQGSRVLIFSQMTRLLDILEDYLVLRDYEYRRIDGSTVGDERSDAIDEFNAPDSDIFIFLLSTRAGGLGINLATADTVILYDSDWNPQVDLQAQDRAHRIGQTKPVTVFRFVTQDSVEEKIVERAEAKLHLDALVIRQGQLVEKNKGLGKDELLGMIRFGADQIFKSKDSTVTDEDIDLIISKGAAKTEQLNEKLKDNYQSLLEFSSHGDFGSMYEFQGVDYSSKHRRDRSWIKLPARARKTNYSVDHYYREVLRVGEPAKKTHNPRPPKQPTIHAFQFFPPRIHELLEKETNAFRKKLEWKKEQAEKAAKAEEKEEEEGEKEEKEEKVEKEKEKEPEEEEPDFGELTEQERNEKEELLKAGFAWNKRDFNAFVKGCERFGRDNVEDIAKGIEGKSVEQVAEYSRTFWKRGPQELSDWAKVMANIEKGEAKLDKRQKMVDTLHAKVSGYNNAWQELTVQYGANKGKAFTPEEDAFMLCMLDRLGYGEWDGLKAEIRRSPLFRFDWFLKSRTPAELNRRCDALIRMVEKEEPVSKGKKRHRTDKTTKPATKKTKLEDGKEKEKEKDKGKQKKTDNNSKSEGALSKRRKGN